MLFVVNDDQYADTFLNNKPSAIEKSEFIELASIVRIAIDIWPVRFRLILDFSQVDN